MGGISAMHIVAFCSQSLSITNAKSLWEFWCIFVYYVTSYFD